MKDVKETSKIGKINGSAINAKIQILGEVGRIRLARAAIASVLLCLSPAVFAQDQASVSPKLHAHHDQFRVPRLVQVKPGIYVAHSYGLANFTFIEGENGIIVIDTGWFAHEMRDALRDLRKITNRPISAIIYTHAHPDHTGGSGLLMEAGRDIPVYAPAGSSEDEWDQAGRQFGISLERAVSQLGLFLRDAGQDPDGGGVGRSPVIGERQFRAPTRLIETRQDIEIDGVRFTMIPAGMDVDNGLMVWIDERRILVCGDTVTGVFPILETPRYVPSRNPDKMAKSFDLALALDPNVVIPGHGRLLLNEADARDVLTANRNLSRFLIDQVDRLINDGMGVEEIVHRIAIPKRLATHPDLQPSYHRKDWMIRGLVMKRLGWNTEMLDLVRKDGVTEAQNLLKLMGREKLVDGFRVAMEKGEYRWAARLARWLTLADGGLAERQIYHAALRKISETTTSANERSYILTELATQKGELDLQKMLFPQKLAYSASLTPANLLDQLRARIFDPDASLKIDFQIEIERVSEPFFFILEDGALISTMRPSQPDFSIQLSRDVLNLLHARSIAWQDLASRADVSISGDRTKFLKFAAVMK